MTSAALLADASLHIARRDAELLLAHTLDQPRTFLLAHPEHSPTVAQRAAFDIFISRRAAGEPLQYLLGTQEFFGLTLRVTRDALIPRPETEHLVEAVIDWARKRLALGDAGKTLRLLDVGTGTGAIALALAAHLPTCEIVATDISPAALALARDNALRLRLQDNVDGKIESALPGVLSSEQHSHIRFLESDLLHALPPTPHFDAIVSNPPYIPDADRATLQREVVEHEPHSALFAGADGLDIYRRLIPQAFAALRPGGLLALEFGFGQSAALGELLEGWHRVRFVDDYAGIPRVALAERP
jgi:release factor glutamine methyltransferase